MFHLRQFNNWVKATLISNFAGKVCVCACMEPSLKGLCLSSRCGALHPHTVALQVRPGCTTVSSVLDLACGKGGDLKKFWLFPDLQRYVGVDVAKVSLQHLVERFNSQSQRRRGNRVKVEMLGLACE